MLQSSSPQMSQRIHFLPHPPISVLFSLRGTLTLNLIPTQSYCSMSLFHRPSYFHPLGTFRPRTTIHHPHFRPLLLNHRDFLALFYPKKSHRQPTKPTLVFGFILSNRELTISKSHTLTPTLNAWRGWSTPPLSNVYFIVVNAIVYHQIDSTYKLCIPTGLEPALPKVLLCLSWRNYPPT